MRRLAPALVACLLPTAFLACEEPASESSDVTSQNVKVCAAVRGNGQKITAHFAALARAQEHFGTFWGVSGGSSGSITSFLLESQYANPLVTKCGTKKCSNSERGARAALLMKSLQGYLDVLAGTEEAEAISALAKVAAQAQAQDIEGLLASDPQAGVAALEALLESDDLRDLINPEVLSLLQTSPDPVAHARDLMAGIQGGLAFKVDSERVLLRPGLVDFEALARKIGRIGSFYAGYGPFDRDGFEAFFKACATPGRGLEWSEVSALPAGDGTCGSSFAALLTAYRDTLLADEGAFASRIDDPVGKYMHVLVSTSVLEGDGVAKWQAARSAYLANGDTTLEVAFDDVKVGYFGADADLDAVLKNERGYADLKTQKATGIRGATWFEALRTSPAEPGLARALELADGRVSAGGWPDLYPVQVLDNLGCDQVLYVTRRGGMLGGFADQVATVLNASEDERNQLFSLDHPESSFASALELAGGAWCTDWDAPPASDVRTISKDAYNAPLESSESFFLKSYRRYPNAGTNLGILGCSPGVTE